MSGKRETNLTNVAANYSFNNTLTHHSERPQGPEYLNTDYEKSSSATRDFCGAIMLFAVRFAIVMITEKCLEIKSRLFPDIFTAFCLACVLYLFCFKKHKAVFAALTFSVSFIVMYLFNWAFDRLQEMTNVFYWEIESLQIHEVPYRIGRLLLGFVFVLLFTKKYNRMNDNSNKNVYTPEETAAYRLTCAIFMLAPFCTLLGLFVKLTNIGIFVFVYSFICIIAILLILTKILLGLKSSFRLDDRYGIAAFVFALLSVYEIIYTALL